MDIAQALGCVSSSPLSNVRSNAPETQAKDDHELHFPSRRNLEKHDWSDRNGEDGEVCRNIRDRVRIIYTACSS
jgi:hypothetical protein